MSSEFDQWWADVQAWWNSLFGPPTPAPTPTPSPTVSLLSVTIIPSGTSGQAPYSVNFTSSVSGGQSPYGYAWDFGDGGISSSANPSYVYQNAGTYEVILTVTDSRGNTVQSSSVAITVSAAPTPTSSPALAPTPAPTPPPVQALAASVSVSPSSGSIPLIASFSSAPSGGVPPYSYYWNFGDGGTSSSANPIYIYENPGTYSVKLVVTDANGNSQSATTTVTVVPPTTTVVPVLPLYSPKAGTPTGVSVPGGSVTTYMGVQVIAGTFGGNPGPLALSNGETVGFGSGIPAITGLPLINLTWFEPGYGAVSWPGVPQGEMAPLDANPPTDLVDMGYADEQVGFEVYGSPSTGDLYMLGGQVGYNVDGSLIRGWQNITTYPTSAVSSQGYTVGVAIVGGKSYRTYSALTADISSGMVAANIAAENAQKTSRHNLNL